MKKHTIDPEPRYDTILSDPDIPGHPSGMIGVIDEERGGIIAWAVDQAQANALIAQLDSTSRPTI